MRCNLVFGLAALLATAVFVNINSPIFSTSSAPENTIATQEKPICDRNNVCFPPPV